MERGLQEGKPLLCRVVHPWCLWMTVITLLGKRVFGQKGKASSHFHLGSEKGKIQCWLQCQVESKYFPFQRCESRLLPIHSRGFSMTIIIACWCFQDILFKVTCKHTHVVDFKIKPLRSQNVKCHSCKCKQGIQIFSFFK